MAEGLKIVIGADTGPAEEAYNKFISTSQKAGSDAGSAFGIGSEKALTRLESAFISAIKPIHQLEEEIDALKYAIDRTTDPAELKRFNDQIGILTTQVNNVKVVGFETSLAKINSSAGAAASGLAKLPNVSNRATSSLIDLGRVVQDAPYGFIGIANNLNPLLENFQRLQKESGGTKNALRSLVSSLSGGGGIGFALSLVTSAISFATIGFSSWTRGLSSSGKATDNLNQRTKEFNETLESVASSLAKDASRVTQLFTALSGGALNIDEKKKALEELKGINSDYFGSLKEEKGIIEGLKQAYDSYLDNLNKIGKAKAIESQLTKLFDRKLQLELSIDPKFITATTPEFQSIIGKLKEKLKTATGGERLDLISRIANLESGNSVFFDQATKKVQEDIKKIDLQISGLQHLLGTNGVFDIKTDKTKKLKDEFDSIVAKAKEIAAFLDKNTQFSVNFEVDPLLSKDETLRKAKEFISSAKNFFETQLPPFDFKPLIRPDFAFNETKFLPQFKKLTQEQATRTYEQAKTEFEKHIEALAKNKPFVINVLANIQLGLKTEELRNAFDRSLFGITQEPLGPDGNPLFTEDELQARKFAKTITGVLTPAFQGLFAAIVAGENPLKAFFLSIGNAIGQLIQKLIAAAVQAAILSLIFPGGAGGTKGFAGFFKNIVGFAGGGIVSGPVLAMVGEGIGTSKSNPEVIAPLDQLKSILGSVTGKGHMQPVVLTTRVRGNNLELIGGRTRRKNGRAGS